jgi:hypothetical protein
MSMPLRLEPDAVEWREVDGEIVALDRVAGEYFAVTGSGTLLWRQLVEGSTTDALAETLVARFALERDAALRDVERFVAALDSRGILTAP